MLMPAQPTTMQLAMSKTDFNFASSENEFYESTHTADAHQMQAGLYRQLRKLK
jgi:hypothetical protein